MKRNRLAALLLALCLTAALLPGAAFASPPPAPSISCTIAYNALKQTNEATITIIAAGTGTVSGTIGTTAFAAQPSPYVVVVPIPTAGLAVSAVDDVTSGTATASIPAPKAAKPQFAYQKEDNFSKLTVVISSATPLSTITCTVNGDKISGPSPVVLHLTMPEEGLYIAALANANSFSTSDVGDVYLRASLFSGGVNGVNPSLPELYPEKSASQFKDVPAGAWYRAELERLIRAGVIDGVTEDSFKPAATLTLAQFTKMLTAALYGDGVEKYQYHKVDNRYDTWYAKYVGAALAGGLYAGVEVNYEKLESPISRYDMAAMLVNAAGVLGENLTIASDIYRRIADYYDIPLDKRDTVAKAYSAGLLEGFDEYGNFYGEENLRRCDACTVLVRLFDTETRVTPK